MWLDGRILLKQRLQELLRGRQLVAHPDDDTNKMEAEKTGSQQSSQPPGGNKLGCEGSAVWNWRSDPGGVDRPEGADLLSGSWDGNSRTLESKRLFPALMCRLLQGRDNDAYRSSACDQIHWRSPEPSATFHTASYLLDCMVDMEIRETDGSRRHSLDLPRLDYSWAKVPQFMNER